MDPVREIILILILRMRAAKRARTMVDPALMPQTTLAHLDGMYEEAQRACTMARGVYKLSRTRSQLVEHERKRVISISTKREEFITLADGYVAFWPQGSSNGALSSWHLRVLADEVDRRNRAWDAHVQRNVPKRKPPEK